MSEPKPKTLRPVVTGRRRSLGRRERATQPAPRWYLDRILLALFWRIVKPRRLTCGAGGLFIAALIFGTPHVIVTYRCTGLGEPGVYCWECNYFGLNGWTEFSQGNRECPPVRFYPMQLLKEQ